MTLPPLPKASLAKDSYIDGGTYYAEVPWDCFSADQMTAYAQAAVLAERAACAELCETLGGASSAWHAEAIRARSEP